MMIPESSRERNPLQALLQENERLKEKNAELSKSVTRLELFNKVIEREVAELKSVQGNLPAGHTNEHDQIGLNAFRKGFIYAVLFVTVCCAAYALYNLIPARRNIVFTTQEYKNPDPPVDVDTIRGPAKASDRAQAPPPARRDTSVVKKINKSAVVTPNTSISINAGSGNRYKVRSRAYFHDEPDESTKRRAFITHWNNAVLSPVEEKDEFIYVVFTNHLAQTSRGWLIKSDLISVD